MKSIEKIVQLGKYNPGKVESLEKIVGYKLPDKYPRLPLSEAWYLVKNSEIYIHQIDTTENLAKLLRMKYAITKDDGAYFKEIIPMYFFQDLKSGMFEKIQVHPFFVHENKKDQTQGTSFTKINKSKVILDSHIALSLFYNGKLQSWCSFGIFNDCLKINQIQGKQTKHSAKPENKIGFLFDYKKFYISLIYKIAHDFGYQGIYVTPASKNKWLDVNRNKQDGHSQKYSSLAKQYDVPASSLKMTSEPISQLYFYPIQPSIDETHH